MENEIRAEREYTVDVREECGGEETLTVTVEAGTEETQDANAQRLAIEATEEWVKGGDYGHEGASVIAYYTLSDEQAEWPEERIEVEIEPDEEYLMKQAGADSGCEHDWTAEGEGGVRENPGVWSTGGTSMMFRAHCSKCGLIKIERTTGSQRNPGEHDTVEFRQPAQGDGVAYEIAQGREE